MKKIFTLAMMAFVFCLSASAQIDLGDIKFSLGEGKKISPTTGKILVLFPNVTGVEDPVNTNFVIEGNFSAEGVEPSEFDGLEESFAKGVTLELIDFELAPSTDYTLTITSVKVDGTNLAPAEGYVLHFKTRSAERKMAWTFVIDEESSAMIMEEGNANSDGADVTKYQPVGSKNRWYVPSRNNEEILLPDGTALPMTEDLLFKFGNKSFYVGEYNNGSYKDRICFNNNNQQLVIPDCQEGDIITFSALRSSKSNTYIQALNGCAIAPDGVVSGVTGLQDSIPMSSSLANHKFIVQIAGDVTFKIGNTLMTAINIEEGQEALPRNYNVVAAYMDDDNVTVLKELVAKTEGMTGSTIKTNYPYWLVDTDGNAYTHGAKGSEFVEAFDLKNGETESDTTFVINYKKTDYTGVVYLSEGEDIPEAVLCTNANAAVRSSMGKSGYVTEDTKLVTLQPGSYKIRAVIFDANKTPGYICTLSKGEGIDNEIYLSATSTNWTETESDLLTITEPTDITLLAGGGDSQGLDVIMIYASVDAPDDPEGIVEVKSAQKVAARKVMKDGRILIQTEGGIFNAIGVQVK